jgi:hypothetical protein
MDTLNVFFKVRKAYSSRDAKLVALLLYRSQGKSIAASIYSLDLLEPIPILGWESPFGYRNAVTMKNSQCQKNMIAMYVSSWRTWKKSTFTAVHSLTILF